MISKKWLRVIVVAMTAIILFPLGADAATVNVKVKSPKKVNTLKITKKWYRPRSDKGKYKQTPVSGISKEYVGRQIVAEKGKQYSFKRYAFLADGKAKGMKLKYNYVKYIGKKGEPRA